MRTLHGQGAGRFSSEELATFCRNVWENVNALLSEARLTVPNASAPFWVQGSQPTEAETTAFGFIAVGLVCDAREIVRGYPMLVDYAKRIHNTYFEDYVGWDELKQ
ncbi:hypothetical protein HDU84_007690 [Entophlyctis sp. JEL0112]|nr:hypothetical protein HDU84_007690 [Entophlyctis sp. JEL0112]